MNLNDILGLGKILPIDKLLDIVSSSVGRISKSYFDKRNVDVKAYEIEKLAEARAKEMKIIATAVKDSFQMTGGIGYKDEKIEISSPEQHIDKQQNLVLNNPTLEERTRQRVDFQEAKKQLNVESVTAFAAEELRNEGAVTNEPLDDDWTSRFFRIAEDISNEEMQALWGKILAGEIKQPKSYSLRTLELVRNLSKREADVFNRVANFAIKSGDGNYIFKGDNEDHLAKTYGIGYSEIALLKELGLIQSGEMLSRQFLQQAVDHQQVLVSGNIVIIIKIKANSPTIFMPIDVFSTIGNELLTLLKPKAPFEYLTYIANSIKNENVEVKYAHILKYEEGMITHTQPLQNF